VLVGSTTGCMEQIHVWRNHVRIAGIDLVLVRLASEHLDRTLISLARLGFDTRRGNVVVHEGVPSG
jgi:hypothetical protein